MRIFADEVAIRYNGTALTYAAIDRLADAAAWHLQSTGVHPVGCQNGVASPSLRFSALAGDLHAARSYSLLSPPRTLRRRMSAVAGPVIVAETFSSQTGGRRFLARCGRCRL